MGRKGGRREVQLFRRNVHSGCQRGACREVCSGREGHEAAASAQSGLPDFQSQRNAALPAAGAIGSAGGGIATGGPTGMNQGRTWLEILPETPRANLYWLS